MMFKKSVFVCFILLLIVPLMLYQHQTSEAAGERIEFGQSLTSFGCDNAQTRGTFSVTTTNAGTSDLTWLATVNGVAYENVIQSVYYGTGTSNRTWNIVSVATNGPIEPMPMPQDEMLIYRLSLLDPTSGRLLSSDTLCIDSCNTGNVIACPASVAASSELECFTDGRINRCDAGNLIVIYGHDYETGRGLLITDIEGNNLLLVMPEAIEAVPECPESNTLIAFDNDVTVYRLAGSCQFQVNAPAQDGKIYVVQFDELHANMGYTSYEE